MIGGGDIMHGAIIGDLAGSIYEYGQLKEIKRIEIPELIQPMSFYSDDTILTMAILDATIHGGDYDKYLREYIHEYRDYKPDFHPYFKSSFSSGLMKWSYQKENGNSKGNGAMMRISPIGYMFDTERDVMEMARLATIPSHNSAEAIRGAQLVALVIFYLRHGLSKEETFGKLGIRPCYTPFKKFNTTCKETLDNCLYVLYHSTGFENAIYEAVAMGGDTDTNACIVGSMAEALYGVGDELKKQAEVKLPERFVKLLRR